MKIAVLLACFNRKDVTMRCMQHLELLTYPKGVEVEIFLSDDNSPDGTANAIARHFPAVHLIAGSGKDFWAGGMRRSFDAALKVGFDFYLWLNDDTLLSRNAIEVMLATARNAESTSAFGTIVVGSITSRDGTTVTYGGVDFPIWWRRTTPRIIYSDTSPINCESFNGNCVLISSAAASVVGNLDPIFTHGLADFDYGLRASALGVKVLVAPGVLGACDRNPSGGTFLDRKLPLSMRWRAVRSDKGFPPRPWAVYTRRHCGNLWLFNWIVPYIRAIFAPSMKRANPIVKRVMR